MKLHTGDTVVIISGKDKGKTGSILRVLEAERRVVVSGANMRTKHVKKTVQEAGRILHFEASLDVSNVMLIDPKTKKRSRVGYKIDDKGKKTRVSKRSGEVVVPVRAVKVAKKGKLTEGKQGKEGKEGKKEQAVAESSVPAAAKPARQPFWRKKTSGVQEGDVGSEPRSKQDHTVPEQQTHVRAGSRGS